MQFQDFLWVVEIGNLTQGYSHVLLLVVKKTKIVYPDIFLISV